MGETMAPTISVVMPVFNAEKYLEEAVRSVLNQTFTDFEFIIVDDASTDNSLELLKKFKDKRIKILQNKNNKGITKSLNKGLRHARGEFIARMDADDICMPKRFEKQVEAIHEFDICGSHIVFINEKGEETGKRKYDVSNLDETILLENPLAHPTVMFRQECIDEVGLYDKRFSSSQDYDLWLRFYANEYKFTVVNEVLLKYRMHSKQEKYQHTKRTIRNVLAIKKKARKEYGLKFGIKAKLRMILERLLLLLPRSFILFLFRKIKRAK